MNRLFSHFWMSVLVAQIAVALVCLEPVAAEQAATPPHSAFDLGARDRIQPWKGKNVRDLFSGRVVNLGQAVEDEFVIADSTEEKQADELAKKEQEARDQEILGRTSAEAPDQFRRVVLEYRKGNTTAAKQHASEYVDYLMNLMFEVREITKIIGGELIAKGAIDEESWVGVEQYLDWEFAQASEENGSLLKATHEKALEKIVPDPEGKVEIYYFFTLSCSYCRYMAPDIERLWQLAKSDPKIKMVALTMDKTPRPWVESYRKYTGLTAPIFEGAEIAKSFNVAMVPAIVVTSPTKETAYLRTGQQRFERMYEFVRKAQGKSIALSAFAQKLLRTPIGAAEKANSEKLQERHRTILEERGVKVTPASYQKEQQKVVRF